MTASKSKPPYLRALLYFLTAPFQSWDLKRLFPIFFTSSATDRTFSIWKEARAKVKLEPLILICSFCHHSSCLCKNKEKETLLTLQTQSLTSRISKQLYFKVKLITCTTMTSVIIWLIITGNTFPPASIIYQTKRDLVILIFFLIHTLIWLWMSQQTSILKKNATVLLAEQLSANLSPWRSKTALILTSLKSMSESSGKSGWASVPSLGAAPQLSPSLCSPQSAMIHGCKCRC